jgi:N-acetylmuramoyl-L-alanine amidase
MIHRTLSAVALAAVLVSAAPAHARGDASEAAYAALKKDADELRRDPEKRKFRHNYEKIVDRLQQASKKHKAGARGDDCAYIAAQLLEELASVSRLSVDKNAAAAAYAELAKRFPSSNLRDDALVSAARLTTDVVQGRAWVDQVLAMKGADTRDEAAALKKSRFTDAVVAEAKKKPKPKPEPSVPDSGNADEPTVGEQFADDARATVARKAEASGPSPSTTPSTTPVAPVTQASMASAFARLQATSPTTASPTTTSPTMTSPAKSGPGTAADTELSALVDDAAHEAPVMRLEHSDAARVAMKPVAVLPERPPPGTPSRKVIVIRHEKTATESSVRLRISGDVGILRGEVPASPGNAGRRIFYDVSPAKLGQRNIQPIEVNDGVIARVRAGQYDVDVVRLVVELEGTREPVLSVTRKPFELVLQTPTAVRADVVAGVSPDAPAPTAPIADEVKERIGAGIGKPGAQGSVSISKQLGLKVHRVVIDAGHGGHDTGAIGPTGVKEKDVTLQIAQRIREKLNAELPDVEVIMTRDDDATLALQDRTNTANSAAADLFISIHCNANPSRRARGVETYFLNITHDKYAMKLAARENSELSEGSISDLDFILADLAMKSNVDDSIRLGREVQKHVVTKLHQSWPDVPDLGLKHALFFVLMGNKMPSILVETSFLSNKAEEKRLASAEYQGAIADGVVGGVRAFVEDRQAFFATP